MALPLILAAVGTAAQIGGQIFGAGKASRAARDAADAAAVDAAAWGRVTDANVDALLTDANNAITDAQTNRDRALRDSGLAGRIAEYNAGILESDAKAAAEAASDLSLQQAKADARTISAQRAIFGSSGVSGTSPYLAATESIENMRENVRRIQKAGVTQAAKILGQAGMARFQGAESQRALLLEAKDIERQGNITANRLRTQADVQKLVGAQRASALYAESQAMGARAQNTTTASLISAGATAMSGISDIIKNWKS